VLGENAVQGPGTWIVTDYELSILRVLLDDCVLAACAHERRLTLTFSCCRVFRAPAWSHARGLPDRWLVELGGAENKGLRG